MPTSQIHRHKLTLRVPGDEELAKTSHSVATEGPTRSSLPARDQATAHAGWSAGLKSGPRNYSLKPQFCGSWLHRAERNHLDCDGQQLCLALHGRVERKSASNGTGFEHRGASPDQLFRCAERGHSDSKRVHAESGRSHLERVNLYDRRQQKWRP